MSFLDFVNKKNAEQHQYNESMAIINEAFKNEDVKKVHYLILKVLKKSASERVVMLPVLVSTKIDGKDAMTISYCVTKGNDIDILINFNYLVSAKSSEVYSIDFFTKEDAQRLLFGDGGAKTALTIYTLGQSVAYFLPLVGNVISTRNFNMTDKNAKDIVGKTLNGINGSIKESYFGALKMNVIEGVSSTILESAFHIRQGHHVVNNGSEFIWETEAEDVKKAVRQAEKESWKTKYDSDENRKASIALDRDYREICKAIAGGATTLKELEVAVGHKITVQYDTEAVKSQKKVEEASKKYSKDPEQAFKEMKAYVNTVLKGLQPGVVLCGAPGVGKTYRVLQQLKANGYERGKNLEIIKGKCSPRELYVTLYTYKNKGDIILIDDADSLIGPKAPEDVINILKAALDSTSDDEGRLVSYKVAGKILDEEGNEIEKSFYFNGACIVITNYSVGQIDTAIKSRVYTQSIDFSTKQLLEVIKTIIPGIAPQKLSKECKMKAYDYLLELVNKNEPIEVSIRSFSTCANLFQSVADDPDFSDDDCKSMILEQLKNQYKKGGHKW